MKHNNLKDTVTVLGIDLAKNSFHLHGTNKNGSRVLSKKLTRAKLAAFVAQMPACLIGIEACGGANYWKRVFERYGHTVKMMSPQFVKPYVKSNKNDAIDAEAICEAVQRPNMRFVPSKTAAQQEVQSLHRIRSQWISQLEQRRGNNVAAVAVANKNARIAWVLLTREINFKSSLV